MITSNIIDHADNPKAMVLFAHGAGADKDSEFMQTMTAHLLSLNISVLRFNFPYMDKRLEDGKRRPPERMPKLLTCFLEQIAELANAQETQLPLFIGGKSMGSRVAATITSNEALPEGLNQSHQIKGAFCLGYPFYPSGKPEKTRLEPLTNRDASILIVQGTRDKLGDQEAISSYQLPKHCQLAFMSDGDHDLKPRVKSGFTHQQHLVSAAQVISDYIDQELARGN